MSITQFPQIEPPETGGCVICLRTVSSEDATFGPVDANGKVAVLCSGHLWDGRHLINMLADYAVEERRKFLNNGRDSLRYGEAADAWSLY